MMLRRLEPYFWRLLAGYVLVHIAVLLYHSRGG